SVGPCHHSSLSAPPPPRRAGLYLDGVWAWATPDCISSCAAIGAVSPQDAMPRMKSRRASRPSRTLSMRWRSSASFMGPHLGTEVPRLEAARTLAEDDHPRLRDGGVGVVADHAGAHRAVVAAEDA